MADNDFPGAKSGDRLTAANINKWIAASKRAHGRMLTDLSSPTGRIPQPPASPLPCVNLSDVDIPAGAPVSLEEPLDQTEAGLIRQFSFGVRLIEDAEASTVHAGIATNAIPYGGAGECYVGGMCLARLTDDNDSLIAAAGLSTIWEEADSGTRWALVRFGGGTTAFQMLILVGGNVLSSGQEGILYASSVTATAVYDPDVDTAYPDGLGRGWLYTDGVRSVNRVLIRHDYTGHTGAYIGGTPLRPAGTEIITYLGTPMTAYRISYA